MRGKQEALSTRFWRFVEKTDGCWLWKGSRNGTFGYGKIGLNGRNVTAHRAAFLVTYRLIPAGAWVLHHCDNPACVRPDHLFLGDRSDNMRDAFQKGRGNFQQKPELIRRGSKHYNAKLTEETAETIKRRYEHGAKQQALATEYGVSQSTISNVVRGVFWTTP